MMTNPLFQQFGNMMMPGNMQQMMSRLQQFRQMFRGDPRQQVQQLLNSGKVTQAQYDQAVQMAQQLQRMIGK